MPTDIEALARISFKPYYDASDIWRDDIIHVDGLHKNAFDEVRHLFEILKSGGPIGNVVIEGRPGIGKSHFLGCLRRNAIADDDFFCTHPTKQCEAFLGEPCSFLLRCLLSGWSRRTNAAGRHPKSVMLKIGLTDQDMKALVAGEWSQPVSRAMRTALQRTLGQGPDARFAMDVAVALCLINSPNPVHQDIGNAIIQGLDIDQDQRKSVSISTKPILPRDVIKAFDRILGLAEKYTLAAVDQLDGLIALGKAVTDLESQSLLDHVANGLMDFAQGTHHTLIIVSCLPDTWIRIRTTAIQAAAAGYPITEQLSMIPSPEIGEALIAAYLKAAYSKVDFRPEYPIWPIKSSAFADSEFRSPRDLINLTEAHIRACRQQGRVTELVAFSSKPANQPKASNPQPPGKPDPDFDKKFALLKQSADIDTAFEEATSDEVLPPLLQSGLKAWVEENSGTRYSVDALPGRKPSIHARLRKIIDAELEDEIHWSFRAVNQAHASSALTKLRSAIAASGLCDRRALVILRNAEWSGGVRKPAKLSLNLRSKVARRLP